MNVKPLARVFTIRVSSIMPHSGRKSNERIQQNVGVACWYCCVGPMIGGMVGHTDDFCSAELYTNFKRGWALVWPPQTWPNKRLSNFAICQVWPHRHPTQH